ncbi:MULTISPECIES: hypothetical protein [unclassified Aureimonas]|uniref:hypothetical protein n=1 Tax=unclassified Aureimonas TaxID=2615206 RepID=UPI0006F5AF74|nr:MULTISPECIES: hypothetical protein [unclassified Aureimonas]KQT52173.1 hypothetical protein ASG62_16070 [Aureimonas sp. Leaf427]KQT70594.1 hypothetical protein ASG54_21880 [Aureimonas sp. Leaf460]
MSTLSTTIPATTMPNATGTETQPIPREGWQAMSADIRKILEDAEFWKTADDADGYAVTVDHVVSEIELLVESILKQAIEKATTAFPMATFLKRHLKNRILSCRPLASASSPMDKASDERQAALVKAEGRG